MLPIRIAMLWHFHQPYYKKNGEFILPWVRLHGVKDYWDLPELSHEFPKLKQTINIAPSLRLQIDEYVSGATMDKIQRLTLVNAAKLTEENKKEILRLFFLCNIDNMVNPYPRYKELHEKSKHDQASEIFSEQDWRDLQVWYNMTWLGRFTRERTPVKRLFNKGRDFTEEEKLIVHEICLQVLDQIKPQIKMLLKLRQLEISSSPMYHPILPLLCDSLSAREATPNVEIPEPAFKYPEDARAQIKNAIDFYKRVYGVDLKGMWPSEGSISDESLSMFAELDVKWVASDEGVLANTLRDKYDPLMKYFPTRIKTPGGTISALFRDHNLSDAIGFVYSRWNHFDAVNDFCHRLRHIRGQLVNRYGEECLKDAVIPVILDGENCWEYYYDNGMPFRRELFRRLTDSADFKTITCSEACGNLSRVYFPAVESVRAGSWINANFNIWIGHAEDRKAWSLLGKTRERLAKASDNLEPEQREKAFEHIYIAEGSDWFWWYGDEHSSENQKEFDELFRWHIRKVYEAMGEEPPEEVDIPIKEQPEKRIITQQEGEIKPSINGRVDSDSEWRGAGYYDAISAMSAMHQVGEFLHRFWFARGGGFVYFRLDTTHTISQEESVELEFQSPKRFSIKISRNVFQISAKEKIVLNDFKYAEDEIVELAVSDKLFFGDEDSCDARLELIIRTRSKDAELTYPRQGSLEIFF